MMAGRMFGYGMHAGGGMFLMMALFAIIIIGAFFIMLRRAKAFQPATTVLKTHTLHTEKQDPAEAILRERYARGEINDLEYDQRLKRLKGETTVEPPTVEPPTVEPPKEGQ